MTGRSRLHVVLLWFAITAPLFGQTSREYYRELKTANGLNALATLACFPEKETGSFAVAALTTQFEATLKSKGLPIPDKFGGLAAPGAEQSLWWQLFYKGIPAAPWLLEKSGQPPHWILKFVAKVGEQNVKGEIDLFMNWSNLRYKLEVRAGRATEVVYGRCEPIL